MEQCEDCGTEYQRIRQHWAMTDCGPDNPSKSELTCENCGDEFTEWTYRVEEGDGVYCSHECRNEGLKNGVTVSCSWCGSDVYRQQSLLDSMGDYSLDHHFCDKECEREFKQVNWVREDHPRWEGGSDGVNAVRNALSDKSWFRVAKENRRNECQNCGAEADNRELDVHHIIPVAAGGTNHEENLITLCIKCHRKIEQYTKKFTEPHLLKPSL